MMVRFIVTVKGTDGSFRDLGVHTFVVAPRVGEYVTFEDESHTGQAYRVKAVLHPLRPLVAAELVLEHVGTDADLRKSV